jgi:hypothetical protein
LRATQVGDSDWIRLDWSVDNFQAPAVDASGRPDLYEIRRTDCKVGEDPLSTVVVGVTSARPDVRVFVDKGKKEANFEYVYEVFPKSASEGGPCASARVPLKAEALNRTVRRHLNFDDGRLPNAKDEEYESVLHPSNSSVKLPWTLKDGKLDWFATNPNAYRTSRLVLGPKTDRIQITARLAVLGDLPPADCEDPGVGVGIEAAGGLRIVSLVLRKSGTDANQVSIHFLHEKLAKAGDPPAGSPLPNAEGAQNVDFKLPGRNRSEPAKLTWIWLKVAIEAGEFRGKAWLDAGSEPPKWAIITKNFKNDGWNNARAVLIGGSGDMRATFGEVFIEGTSPAQTTTQNGASPAQERPSDAGVKDVALPEAKPTAEELATKARLERLAAVAFEDLPTVVRLVPRASMRPDERDQVEGPRASFGTNEDPARHFDFAAPAHFPLPQFNDCDAEGLDDEGVVIYEGMRLDVASDGRYEVRFIATTPAMPVTLRLQFRLRQYDGSDRTVTIPPIEIPPHRNSRGEYESATWKIRHQGYSYNLATRPTPQVRDSNGRDQLREDGRPGSRDGDYRFVQRTGTARFGSYPSSSY